MAADYWQSTQRQRWKFTREQLSELRSEVLSIDANLGLEDPCHSWEGHIRLYIFGLVQTLALRLNLRQRVIASAHTYLLRVFTKLSMNEINVYLLVATAVYMASKAEEQPHHIRTVSQEARILWAEYMPTESAMIAECEFYLMSELESCLVVFHPYRSLRNIAESMSESHPLLVLSGEELQGIWALINDSYASDIILRYAPNLVALACLYMTIVLRPQLARPPKPPDKVKARIDVLASYLGKSAIDLEQLAECVQELVSLCARWETYDQQHTHSRVVKSLLS